MKPPRVLIIAGSDSGGGAGIQADIKTVTMFGGHAMTAIAALTAQNTKGVEEVLPIDAAFVLKQMDMVIEDLGVDAVKIGMIGSAETADAVAGRLEQLNGIPIVFDPVMVATSGSVLADEKTIAAFERLMRASTLVTPNAPELRVLSGGEGEQAALELSARAGTAVLAKGGDIPGSTITDLLVWQGEVRRWEADRIETRHLHGTGCTLASAIATELGRGIGVVEAVERGRAYVRDALAAAPGFGGGSGPMGHALGLVPVDAIHRKSH